MIGRQGDDGAVDLLAVQRDDELLDLLGAHGDLPTDDELARLLSAWRDEIDHGLAALLPDRVAPSPASAPPVADVTPADDVPDRRSRRRRLTVVGTVVGVVLGGNLSLTGVAAAVSGDPLAPYRAVGNALSFGGDDLPDNAAQVAHLNKRLSRARAALAHGDVAGVQSLVDDLTTRLASAELTDQQRAALQRRLDSLRAAIARAAADAEKGSSTHRGSAAMVPSAPGKGAQSRAEDKADEGGTTRDGDAPTGAADAKRDKPAKPTGTAPGDENTDGQATDSTGDGTSDTDSTTDSTPDGGDQDATGQTQTSTGASGTGGGSGRRRPERSADQSNDVTGTVTGSASSDKASPARR